jgi:hypothetical protein
MQSILKEIVLSNVIVNNKKFKWYDHSHCSEFYTLLITYEYKSKQYYEFLSRYEINKFISQSPHRIFKYVKNQTDELCKLAVKFNPRSLSYVKNQTKDIINFAINIDGCSIMRINNYNKYSTNTIIEFWKNSINKVPSLITELKASYFSPDIMNELYKIALTKNYELIQRIKPQTYDLCLFAMSIDKQAFRFIDGNDLSENEYEQLSQFNYDLIIV